MEFQPFEKMARLSRECVITEKIDGTNASIYIGEDGSFLAGSRTRWITPINDNFGFATWAMANKEELMGLGVGHHFGEWWGRGIQRNYSQAMRHFSLFHVARWADDRDVEKYPLVRPTCCGVVPILYRGPFDEFGVMRGVQQTLRRLQDEGSVAAPGFMKPEGIVLFHSASGTLFKKTLEKDASPKGAN